MVRALVLPVRKKWFDQIRAGTKTEEYRLVNDYWQKRLGGGDFSEIVVTHGYPRKGDAERRITFPWRGFTRKTVTSEEWGNEPVEVFAIKLAPERSYDVTVWDVVNGDVIKSAYDADDDELNEIEEQYRDEPGIEIQIEERSL